MIGNIYASLSCLWNLDLLIIWRRLRNYCPGIYLFIFYVYWFVRETKSFFDEKYENLQELESDRTIRSVPNFSSILLTSISKFFERKFQNESMFWKLNSIVGHMKLLTRINLKEKEKGTNKS